MSNQCEARQRVGIMVPRLCFVTSVALATLLVAFLPAIKDLEIPKKGEAIVPTAQARGPSRQPR